MVDLPAERTRALVEFADIYPSLCDLAGLPLPDHLGGYQLHASAGKPGPGLENRRVQPIPASWLSELPYPPAGNQHAGKLSIVSEDCDHGLFHANGPVSFWSLDSGGQTEEIIGVELYDHVTDPAENVNIATLPENADLVAELTQRLRRGWRGELPPG